MAQAAIGPRPDALVVDRWPGERFLHLLVVLAALGVWLALVVSVIGILYVALIGVFLFVAHLAYITHLRGNGVRLGPDQMPELYDRVQEISRRLGMKSIPEAHVVQEGGILNALATKFMRSNFIVLFSDLLEACGDNTQARDFIVAHELGHLRAGHLRWRWLLLPGYFVPFLGSAYSRACEYTSDRYGIAVCGDREAALDGLCILSAGGEHGPRVNRRALVSQRGDLNNAWMKLGHWLQSHPPISHRLAVLDPRLAEGPLRETRAAVGALAIVLLAVGLPIAAAVGAWPLVRDFLASVEQSAKAPAAESDALAQEQVRSDILALVAVVEDYRARKGELPAHVDAVYAEWEDAHPGSPEPFDPYDGKRYGYQVEGGEFVLWSSGPDPEDASDDLSYSSKHQP